MTLKETLSEALEALDVPPERNCSCHINPPCSDCVDNSHLREVRESLHEWIAQLELWEVEQAKLLKACNL